MTANLSEEEIKELAFLDDGFIRMYGLHPNNALDYFALSPFYDKSSNNELVRMQRRSLEVLNSMKGIEFRLLHSGHEPVLFIVVKQERTSPSMVRRLGIYYILDKVIYAAPTLQRLIVTRLLKTSTHIQHALDLLYESMRFTPSKGFTWHFDGDDPSYKLWGQSAEGVAYEMRRKARDERLERRGEEEIGGILTGLTNEFINNTASEVVTTEAEVTADQSKKDTSSLENGN